MIIETWIAALFFVLIAIIGVIGLLGWMIADQRNDEMAKENKALHKENKALRKENAHLKGKIHLARLYIEMEEKK